MGYFVEPSSQRFAPGSNAGSRPTIPPTRPIPRTRGGPATATYDANGNVSEYLADDGTVAAHFEYSPFGRVIHSTGSPDDFVFRFSTKYTDVETGLLYYGFRYYDSETGRWVSRDPIGERGGLNLFSMVKNVPINRYDYLGLDDKCSVGSRKHYFVVSSTLNAAGTGISNEDYTTLLAASASSFALAGLVNEVALPRSSRKNYVEKNVESFARALASRAAEEVENRRDLPDAAETFENAVDFVRHLDRRRRNYNTLMIDITVTVGWLECVEKLFGLCGTEWKSKTRDVNYFEMKGESDPGLQEWFRRAEIAAVREVKADHR